MAVLMELELPITPEQYDAVDAALDARANPPDGFLAHTARFEGDKLLVADIWESAEAYGSFAESQLGPAIASTLGDDAPPPPQPEFTELHNAYKA